MANLKTAQGADHVGGTLGGATLAHQHFLGDRGDMGAIVGKDVTDRQAATTDVVMACEIVQMPLINAHRAMKPDGVIKTRRKELHHRVLVGVASGRMSMNHRVGWQVVAEIRQPTPMDQLIIAKITIDLHPRRSASSACSRRPTKMICRYPASLE